MEKKEGQSTWITYLLIVLLGIISIIMVKSITSYYSSPMHKVDCYLRYLNTRQYHKIPQLLSKQSISEFKNKDEISNYYNKIYNQRNQLMSATVKKHDMLHYMVEYTYTNNRKESHILSLIKERNKWSIQFPFERQEVSIFAPYGSKVYLDSEPLRYNTQNGSYQGKNILPGSYLLQVCFEKEGYSNYYKMIEIPKEKSYIIPYNTAYVEVKCPSHLKVTLGHFCQESIRDKAVFKDILQEDYLLHIQDENGLIEAKSLNISLVKGKNEFDIKEFTLTGEGKQRLNDFIEQFYSEYVKAISCHSHEKIAHYFEEGNREKQLNLFDDWYIKQKDISNVMMNLKIGDYTIDESGNLCIMLREVSQLANEEENERNEEKTEKQYRVLLDFEVTLNILEGEWKIENRKLVQSLVAFKDKEGKWIQY